MTETLNRNGVADILGVSATTIDRWHRNHRLPAPIETTRMRGRVWSKTAIDAWRRATIQSERCGEQSDDDALVSAFRTIVDSGAMSKADVMASVERSLLAMVADLSRGQSGQTRATIRAAARLRRLDLLDTLPTDYRRFVSAKLAGAFTFIARLRREIPDAGEPC